MEILILLWFGSAIACAVIADSKGLGGCLWFVLGFVFGFFALLVVAVLPSQRPTAAQPSAPGVIDTSPQRRCPACAELIRAEALKCRFCGSEVEPAPAPMFAPVLSAPEHASTWWRGPFLFVAACVFLVIGFSVLTLFNAPPRAPASSGAPLAGAPVAWRYSEASGGEFRLLAGNGYDLEVRCTHEGGAVRWVNMANLPRSAAGITAPSTFVIDGVQFRVVTQAIAEPRTGGASILFNFADSEDGRAEQQRFAAALLLGARIEWTPSAVMGAVAPTAWTPATSAPSLTEALARCGIAPP